MSPARSESQRFEGSCSDILHLCDHLVGILIFSEAAIIVMTISTTEIATNKGADRNERTYSVYKRFVETNYDAPSIREEALGGNN